MRRSSSQSNRWAWLLVRRADQTLTSLAVSGADVIVADLSAVGRTHHEPLAWARELLRVSLRARTEVFWQVHSESEIDLLDALEVGGWSGVVLAGEEPAKLVDHLDLKLGEIEAEQGLSPACLEVVACLEHARANVPAADLIRGERITTVTLGRADAVMDLRPEPSGDIHLMGYLSRRLILLATAFGKTPIGAWWTVGDYGLESSPEGSYRAARMGRAMGFRGAMCVREDQVKHIQAAYVPSPAEQKRARSVLAGSYDAAVRNSWADDKAVMESARAMLGETASALWHDDPAAEREAHLE